MWRNLSTSADPLDLLRAAGGEQGAGPAFSGNRYCPIEFEQRLQHERALVHARVGHRQAGTRDLFFAEKQEVEVERPGRIGKRPLAVVASLDALQAFEQHAGGKAGVERRDGVEELGLVLIAEGRGAVEARVPG